MALAMLDGHFYATQLCKVIYGEKWTELMSFDTAWQISLKHKKNTSKANLDVVKNVSLLFDTGVKTYEFCEFLAIIGGKEAV